VLQCAAIQFQLREEEEEEEEVVVVVVVVVVAVRGRKCREQN